MNPDQKWYAACALRRACVMLELQAERLGAAGNYDCMFPEEDAKSLRVLLESMLPVEPPAEPVRDEEEFVPAIQDLPLCGVKADIGWKPMPLGDWRTAPWLSKTDEPKDVSDDSLKRALLTPDGLGVDYKVRVLTELLERACPF